MGKFNRVIALLLGALSISTLTFSACGGGGDNSSSSTPPKQPEICLVEDGETNYEIVLPKKATNREEKAAAELNLFLKRATGVKLNIVTDNEVGELNTSAEYIYLGETKQTTDAVDDYSEETLTSQGYIIKQIDKAIFLVGGSDFGTLFSVYEFLGRTIDWDCIAVDEIIYTETDTVKIENIDVVDVPDIEYRVVGNYQAYNDDELANRFRFIRAHSDGFMYVNGRLYHNSLSYLPPEQYNNANNPANYHPKWYMTENVTTFKGLQLCYTAHGDAAEYEKMQQTALDALKKAIKANPKISNVQFTMEDNSNWCTCTACAAVKQKYGADSAVVILFLNDLREKLDLWMTAEKIKREINLVFFAYLNCMDAPVKTGMGGIYSLIDGLKCADGVYVFYAPIYANYYTSLGDTKNVYGNFQYISNKKYYEDIRKWSMISDQLYFWYYSTNFRYYFIPFCNFGAMQDNFRIAKENNVKYLFNEGQHYNETPNPTGFTYLKDYLESKLMWDVEADAKQLTEKFFTNYFGAAAEPMRKYYDQLNAHADSTLKYRQKQSTHDLTCYDRICEAKYWPKDKLKAWLGYIDEAYAAIESVKALDQERYEILKNRILKESIAIRFLYLDLHSNTDADIAYAEVQELKKAFKKDAIALRFTEHAGQPISDLWSKWGV